MTTTYTYKNITVTGQDERNTWETFIIALADTEFDAWTVIREMRDALLAASDHSQAPDAPLTGSQVALWVDYRQALRDIPQRYPAPAAVVWPVAPSEMRLKQAALAEDRPAFADDTIIVED